jgi:hypothetical protein
VINAFKVSISFDFKKKLMWAGFAVSLFSCAAWAQTYTAQTYPVSGVWVEGADRFPGSTAGECLILRKSGVDAVLAQPFPNFLIFSKNRRFEVRGDRLAEKNIRSVKSATDGSFQITESLGKLRYPFFRRRSFTLNVIDATTIEITEGKVVTQFSKWSFSFSL